MTLSRPPRGHYTEAEVARALDLSLEDLRALVRKHILDREEDAANLPITCYQPADLLLLRLIVTGRGKAAA
jgi:hypothetical protein